MPGREAEAYDPRRLYKRGENVPPHSNRKENRTTQGVIFFNQRGVTAPGTAKLSAAQRNGTKE